MIHFLSLRHTHTHTLTFKVQTQPYLWSRVQRSSHKIQFPAHLSNNRHHYQLTHHNKRDTKMLRSQNSFKVGWRWLLTLAKETRGSAASWQMKRNVLSFQMLSLLFISSCNSCSAMVFILSLTNQGGCVLLTTPLTPIHNSFIYWGLAYSGFSLFSLSLFWKIAFGYLIFWPNFNILWVNYKFCCTCVVQNANESFQF